MLNASFYKVDGGWRIWTIDIFIENTKKCQLVELQDSWHKKIKNSRSLLSAQMLSTCVKFLCLTFLFPLLPRLITDDFCQLSVLFLLALELKYRNEKRSK